MFTKIINIEFVVYKIKLLCILIKFENNKYKFNCKYYLIKYILFIANTA